MSAEGVSVVLDEWRKQRRERIATAVLPVLVKNFMADGAAREAIKYADALIAELDK